LIPAAGWEARVREAFARQGLMRSFAARIAELAPGRCAVEVPFRDGLTQHHGMFHAGVITTLADNACGFAAMTLVPDVMTVEFKVNFLRPGAGALAVARAEVIKPGRTITWSHEGFTFVPLRRRAGRIRGPWLRRTCGDARSGARPFGPQVGASCTRHRQAAAATCSCATRRGGRCWRRRCSPP
jgi:uncharacterized protein (TIGR00369 family)